jgi:hypothetical protein
MDTLNEKIEGLVKKSEKSKMPYGILKKVYDRGMAAWKTGHRPGTTPQQWAFARVNSFITKSSGTWGKADKDLAKQVTGEQVESKTKSAKDMIGQVKEKLPKDADASDYVKDFKKSDAPQFKGKSDKKKEKMAVAAYLDSKEEVKEENCPKCNDDPCKCETIQESGHTDVASMKTQVQIATDALQKMNTELGKLSDEEDLPTWWTNKVASAVGKLDGMADYIDAKHQQGDKMNEASRQLKDPKKETMVMKKGKSDTIMVIDKKDLQKYISKGYLQVESNLQEKEMTYTVVHVKKGKEVIKAKSSYDAAKKFAKMKGLSSTAGVDAHLMEDNITEQTVFVVRFEKEGMRFATPFHDMKRAKEGEIILKKTPGVSYIKITKDVLKPGIFLNNPVKEGIIVKEENLSVNLMEFKGIITIDTKNSNISKQLAYHLRYDLPSEFDVPLEIDGGEQGDTRFHMSPDMDNRDVKKFAAYLKKKYGNSIKLQLEGVEQVQEVDNNSLMAQATRVISQTAIKEKLDPADVDMKATDLDRKAADKNIFIQLKRAQDMKGKADVEFLDKKKQKVDIRVINKALDMFDKLKPADKAKMQTAMGKSYRDLLKVVQRGKV